MRLGAIAVLAGLALCLAPPAGAAVPSRLDGSCSFSGPIKPTPPITVVPRSGAHFSFRGKGHCDGHLDGKAISSAPVAVTFTNVETAFDTCEVGPDVNLHGILTIATSRFDVVADVGRLVLAGPLRVTTTGNGLALGTAQFQPGNSSTAPQQCVGAGLTNATLAASFRTVNLLVGVKQPPTTGKPKHGRGHTKHKKRRHGHHRGHTRHAQGEDSN